LLLIYVGIKMSIAIWYHIPVPISLGIIITVLTVGIVASIMKDRSKKA
jgi:predicted tellurium resistance membrane protein TerC